MTDQDTTPAETPEAESERLLNGEAQPALDQPQDETKGPGEDAAATEGVTDGEDQPRPKHTAQERINEMTRLRREAERERDHWREQALAAQQRPEPAQPAYEPQQGDYEPDPAAYAHGEADAAYVRDLARYEARQEFAYQRQAYEAQQQEQAQQQAAQRAAAAQHQAWQAAIDAGTAKYPDFHEVVVESAERQAWPCTDTMAEAITTSEAGADVAYHLAKNPTEARRIAALTPLAQVREITRLEQRVAAPPAPPTPPKIPGAPPPPPSARGSGGRFSVDPGTADFAAFERQFSGAS